jgi:Tfp pilus assembly protein PilW
MERHREGGRRRTEAGFTLVELTIALFVTVEVVLAVLLLFDFSNKLSRVQSNVTDMQQSLRIAQYDTVRLIRMAGRGGLPEGTSPAVANAYRGAAIAVEDNVAPNTHITDAASPTVLAGTDILTVRGVFSSPVYHPASFTLDNLPSPNLATKGTVVVKAVLPVDPKAAPDATMTQDISALKTAVQNAQNGATPEALILVGADETVFAVVELDPGTSDTTQAGQVTLGFRITGGTNTPQYAGLSAGGGFPAALNNAWTVGILEEYRFYVREEYANSAAPTTDTLTSKLSRARVFPNTTKAWGTGTAAANATNLQLDIADNVTDFQVALGFDSPQGAGSISAGTSTAIEDLNSANDDWLFNAAGDSPDTPAKVANWNGSPLYYVRLTTLVRTDRPDQQYTAPLITRIEDRDYTGSPFNDPVVTNATTGDTSTHNRNYRRRLLQTIIDLRNLG